MTFLSKSLNWNWNRSLILFFVIFTTTIFPSISAFAQTDIFIRGSGKLFPIAVPQLCVQSGDTAAGKEIPKTMARDLDISGYFEVLEAGSYIETPGKCGGQTEIAYSDWSIIGAEGLVKGVVTYDGSRLKVQMYLHDVQRQKVVLGKEYEGDPAQASKIAHKFANEIMKFFTGEYGVFGTQIAFTSKVGRFKELSVMDMDGSNLRQLTNDRALSVSSAWDETGSRLVYTSYRQRMPDLFVIDVARKAVQQITRNEQLEVGSKFGIDGSTILTSISNGSESDIVLLGLNGSVIRKLTTANGAIDVSPDYSPDQSQIVFCSNRAGGPQIYVMDAQGGGAHRISFVSSNYCTSPVWSPKGDRIAFVCRADGGFNMFSVKPDGSDALQLTSSGDNEDPDWSPDGRYLAFATTFGKGYATSIALMRSDGSSIKQLTSSRIGDSEPTWGPMIN